jgi:hypothetical protein
VDRLKPVAGLHVSDFGEEGASGILQCKENTHQIEELEKLEAPSKQSDHDQFCFTWRIRAQAYAPTSVSFQTASVLYHFPNLL